MGNNLSIKQTGLLGIKILFAIVFLMILFEVYVFITSDIVIIPTSPTDPKAAFTQQFVISSKGAFALHDVAIWMDLANVVDLAQNSYGNQSLLTQHVKRVEANQPVTIDSSNLFPPTKEPIHKVEIDIEISYRPSYLPFRKAPVKFRYYVERNTDGTIYWRLR